MAARSKGLRPRICWDCGFESRRGHGCLLSVLCFVRQRSLRWADHSPRGLLPRSVIVVIIIIIVVLGRDSAVDLATRYGLDGSGIESRLWATFSASVHTGPGAIPASCKVCTGSLSGGLSGRGEALTVYPI